MRNARFVSRSKSQSLRIPRPVVGAGLLFVVTSVGTSWSSAAHASRAYAYVLTSAFGFGGGCPSCHDNLAGGFGTVTQPFGVTMMSLGLRGNDATTLYEALVLLETSNLDSDGDTIADFDELSPDGNPNDPTVFPAGATPVPSTPPAPSPTTTVSPQPTTSAPATSAPATSAPATPAPPDSADDGGCSVSATGSNGAGLWLALVSAVTCLTRRRRSRARA